MTGCYVDQFDDDPDTWQALREDDYAADDYLNNRLEADDTRRQNKEAGA